MIRTPTFRHVPALFAAMCVGLGVLCPAPTAAAQAEPASPQPAPAEPAPAAAPVEELAESSPSLLSPRFQVGQHAVIEQTVHKSRKGDRVTTGQVQITILEKNNNVFVIQWQLDPPDLTKAPESLRRTLQEHPIPPLLVLFEEGVGIVGVKDWKKARNDWIEHAIRLAAIKPQPDGSFPDKQALKRTEKTLRRTLYATRESSEATLLTAVHAYFDGAYNEGKPGERYDEELEVPWPLPKSGKEILIPMVQSVTIELPSSQPPTHYTCVTELRISRGKAAKVLREFFDEIAPHMPANADNNANAAAEFERVVQDATVERTTRWTLDLVSGWPSFASTKTTTRILDNEHIDEMTYTLVEGPTMKVAEEPAEAPKTDIAPTQLDTP